MPLGDKRNNITKILPDGNGDVEIVDVFAGTVASSVFRLHSAWLNHPLLSCLCVLPIVDMERDSSQIVVNYRIIYSQINEVMFRMGRRHHHISTIALHVGRSHGIFVSAARSSLYCTTTLRRCVCVCLTTPVHHE